VRILSGVFQDERMPQQVTTGTPIALLIENVDARSKDYSDIRDKFRPGHADYTYWAKYGVRDYRGGGRQSARETAFACRGRRRRAQGSGIALQEGDGTWRAGSDRSTEDRSRKLGLGRGSRATRFSRPMRRSWRRGRNISKPSARRVFHRCGD